MTINDLKGGYNVVAMHPVGVDKQHAAKDALQTASDIGGALFPGTKTMGDALGTAAVGVGQLAGVVPGGMHGAIQTLASGPTVPQQIGATVAAGASALGTAGVGSGGGVLMNALKSAGVGAAIGGGSAAAQGKDAQSVLGSTALGAGVGAGTSLAANGVDALANGLRALPQRLIRSATGQSKNDILAGKDIAKYVLENKRIGTADSLIKSSQQAIDQADKFIGESLASETTKTVPLKNIIEDITSSINSSGGEIDDQGVQAILTSLAPQVKRTLMKPELTLSEANQLRSQLDSTLGNRAFISAQLPYNKGILMDFTNAVREQVKGAAPEGTRAAFTTLSKEITLRNLLLNKTAGASRNQIIGLGDLISGGIGGSVGGLPGIIGGAAVKRAAESTLTKTGGAVAIHHLDQALSPVLDQMEPAAKTAVINAIVQAFNQESPAGQ